MATWVLVHGAYHGGWCWDAVAAELRAQGDDVHAPTLTGLSERRGSFSRRIDLDTHVADVVSTLEERDLRAVNLVGWSYGGMVATGALGRVPARLASVVYLDAYLPRHGESIADTLSPWQRVALRIAGILGKGVPPPDPERAWAVTSPALLAAVRPRLSPQPARTLTQKVHAPEPWPEHVSYGYVWCEGYVGSGFGRFHERAVRDPRFRTRRIDASHAALLTHPREVAEALLACSEGNEADRG